VAAKTGTSDDKRDNWCFGYTPEIVVGAWVGNNDNSPMDPALSSGITGATPIWHDLMAKILEGRENLAFRRPEGIIETIVDNNHDLAIIGLQQKSTVALRKVKKVNTENGQEEETSNFSDQFSTYNPSQQTQSL
jgi:membrane carboxypeptidase/penicillin-binding protein